MINCLIVLTIASTVQTCLQRPSLHTSVHYYFSGRYFFSAKKFIRKPMRSCLYFIRQQKNAISVFILCASPKPASFCLFYSRFKNIVWTKLRELMQCSIISSFVVAWSAKFTTNGFSRITNNTKNSFSGLIGHCGLLSGTSTICHTHGGGKF